MLPTSAPNHTYPGHLYADNCEKDLVGIGKSGQKDLVEIGIMVRKLVENPVCMTMFL